MIELDGIEKHFGPTPVFTGLCLTIAPGERVVVSGPSGCGKTTLLRIITGLDSPDAGRITIDGRIVHGQGWPVPPNERHLGVVFQQAALWPNMSVRGNIAFATALRAGSERSALIDEIAGLCGLDDLMDRMPATLSGGQSRRVALARALACRPRYLLLDEPTSNLDDAARGSLNTVVRNYVEREQCGLLYISHAATDIEEMAGTHVMMRDGRLERRAT